jgi:hypothetical protein
VSSSTGQQQSLINYKTLTLITGELKVVISELVRSLTINKIFGEDKFLL